MRRQALIRPCDLRVRSICYPGVLIKPSAAIRDISSSSRFHGTSSILSQNYELDSVRIRVLEILILIFLSRVQHAEVHALSSRLPGSNYLAILTRLPPRFHRCRLYTRSCDVYEVVLLLDHEITQCSAPAAFQIMVHMIRLDTASCTTWISHLCHLILPDLTWSMAASHPEIFIMIVIMIIRLKTLSSSQFHTLCLMHISTAIDRSIRKSSSQQGTSARSFVFMHVRYTCS